MNIPDLILSCKMPPKEAIAFFQRKGMRLSPDGWQDTRQEAHAVNFTVAKVAKVDILQDIRNSIDEVQAKGIGFHEWAKNLEPMLRAKGWWGKVDQVNPTTGAMEKVQLGSPYRLRTIYDTNLQQAYNAGRWKSQSENTASRPYVQRIEIDNEKTCGPCREINGKIVPFDDPLHQQFGGMLHYRCHGEWRGLTKAEVEKSGMDVSTGEGNITQEQVPVSKDFSDTWPVSVYTDPKTGKQIRTQPGFSYNPGKAAWQPDLDRYDYEVAKQYVGGRLTGPDFKRFFDAAGKIKGNYPVAILPAQFMKLIGTKLQAILLSDETLAKNIENHKDLSIEDYQYLPEIADAPQVVIEKDGQYLVCIRQGDKYYLAAMKTTQDRSENYLTSLRPTSKKDVLREMKTGTVKKNEMGK